MRLIPNSYGATQGRSTLLREGNDCHEPAGSPKGGQFCSKGRSSTFDAKEPIRQPTFPLRRSPLPDLKRAVADLGDTLAASGLTEEEIADRQFQTIREQHPEIVADAENLIREGKSAYRGYVRAMYQIARRMKIGVRTNITDQAALNDPNSYVFVAPIKGLRRTVIKAVVDYGGDVSQVKDIVRGTIAVRSAEDLNDAILRLREVADIIPHPKGLKDNVTRPGHFEYRDLNVLVRLRDSGMLAEVQILTKPMLKAKMTFGHRLYEKWRLLTDRSPEWHRLGREMEAIYRQAWAASAPTATAVGALALTVGMVRGG